MFTAFVLTGLIVTLFLLWIAKRDQKSAELARQRTARLYSELLDKIDADDLEMLKEQRLIPLYELMRVKGNLTQLNHMVADALSDVEEQLEEYTKDDSD